MSTQPAAGFESLKTLGLQITTWVFGWTLVLIMPPPATAERFIDTRSDEYLNVVGIVPLEEEVLKDRIVIFFDDRISLPEPARLVAPPPFTIDPPLDGEFKVGSNAVSFVPKSVSPEQIYRITLNSELRSASRRSVNPTHREFFLASAVFRPKRLWVIAESQERVVAGLLFTFAVELDALRQHITVRSKTGNAVPYSLEQGDNEKTFRLILEDVSDCPVQITVAKCLPDKTGLFQTREDFTKAYPSEGFVTVRRVFWSRYVRDLKKVNILFSTNVQAEELDSNLTITDHQSGKTLDHSITSSGWCREHEIAVSVPDPDDAEITITIAEGLAGDRGTSLYQTYSTTLRHRTPPLTINYTSWRDRRKKGMALCVGLNTEIGNVATTEDLLKYIEITPELPNMTIEYDSGRTSRFYIYGDWAENRTYELTLKESLPFTEASKLRKPITRFIKVGKELPSWLGFGYENQYYFPNRNGIALPLHTRRAPEVDLTLYRMFPSNIVVSLRDMRSGGGGHRFNRSWCEKISSASITISGSDTGLVTTPIELDDIFPKNRRGVFCLEASVPKGPSATKMILFTDIGLLAHWRNEELVVFAHDLFSLAPLASAKVTVYSDKNQVLGDARTDHQGMVHIKEMNDLWGRPVVVVVEHGDDFAFLELTSRNEGAREIQHGMPVYDRDAYDAFIYADRDLYRPGETVHLRWIVRTNYGDALAEIPLLVNVIKPNGKKLLSRPTTLSTLGTGGMDLPTQPTYPTGQYKVQLTVPGSKRALGTYSFHLEEFVPNRIKAGLVISEDRWLAGQEYEISVHAEHLFGAPAVNRKCEAIIHFRRGGFRTEKWKDYRFDNDSNYRPESISLGEAKTDENGSAKFKFTYIPDADVTFPLTATVVGQVFELGGRAVTARENAVVSPSDILLGIAATNLLGGRGVEVHAAAIRLDETPAPLDKINVTLERQVWNYYVRRYYSNNQPSWTESFEEIETREIDLQEGRGSTQFEIEGYGYYRVRAHSDQTQQYSTLSFYSYRGRCELVDAARPSLIKLSLDKAEYNVGDEAVVRIESPFDGRGIVVLQGETIEKMMSVEIRDNVGVVKIPLTEAEYPNVWVEATVIHAVQEGHAQLYPFSSFAMANLRVHDPKRKIQIAIPELPEEIRPATTELFLIEVRDHDGRPVQAELTLAAVDEGIHTITNYQDPDPYAWIGRPRRPDFRRAHYYDRVVYDFKKTDPGGDAVAEAELAKRLTTDLENWIKPVALWSGVVMTDPNGLATVSMNIPEFTGQLRLVVVACTEKAVGAHSDNLLVRRYHMLRTSMPRFMLPGDSAQCRAVVFNNSDEPCKAMVRWTASGTLQPSTGEMALDIPEHGENNLLANVIAGDRVGQGEIRWETTIFDPNGRKLEHLTEIAPLPVSPPAAFQSHHEVRVAKPGETIDIRNERFLNDERAEIELTVGANPALQLEDALSYLLDYPYGCIEQITSRLMPLYLLRRNAALIDSAFKNDEPLDSYIQAGIDQLFAMQIASGGLGFWPGAREPYPYGSVYALHFLTLVKNDRKLDLPEENHESLKNYVRGLIMDWSDRSKSALYQRAYSVYVLALGGELDAIQQISRFDDILLPRASRFLLAAALAQNTKDRDRIRLYLSETPSEPYLISEPDKTLNSEIRNTAIELMALKQMEGDPALMAQKAGKLTTFLQNNRYGTTQETAFIVTALGTYLADISINIDKAAARIEYSNNAETKEATIERSEMYRGRHTGPDGLFTVKNTGETDLIVSITTRGIPEKVETEAISEGISVSREFYSDKKEVLTKQEFHQGDNYIVGLIISCEQKAKNVVVVDLLPGGFEVENPRLAPDAVPKGKFAGAITPSHLGIRDDRVILAFDELSKGTHYFYYVVRAVTPGTFQYPPVQAECMYDPSVHGASAFSSIEVR